MHGPFLKAPHLRAGLQQEIAERRVNDREWACPCACALCIRMFEEEEERERTMLYTSVVQLLRVVCSQDALRAVRVTGTGNHGPHK